MSLESNLALFDRLQDLPYVGWSSVKVDDKGRFAIPHQFRRQMTARANGSSGVIYVAPAERRAGYIAGYDSAAFKLQKAIDESEPDMNKWILVGAHVERLDIDAQGRILIPASIAERAQIAHSSGAIVAASPNFVSIEIWSPERFNQYYQPKLIDHGTIVRIIRGQPDSRTA